MNQQYGGVGGAQQAKVHEETPVYLCGDCGSDNSIKPKEPIRCQECGCRVLYKKRLNRMVQFEAR